MLRSVTGSGLADNVGLTSLTQAPSSDISADNDLDTSSND